MCTVARGRNDRRAWLLVAKYAICNSLSPGYAARLRSRLHRRLISGQIGPRVVRREIHLERERERERERLLHRAVSTPARAPTHFAPIFLARPDESAESACIPPHPRESRRRRAATANPPPLRPFPYRTTTRANDFARSLRKCLSSLPRRALRSIARSLLASFLLLGVRNTRRRPRRETAMRIQVYCVYREDRERKREREREREGGREGGREGEGGREERVTPALTVCAVWHGSMYHGRNATRLHFCFPHVAARRRETPSDRLI